jgi:hypothetical protein
MAGIETRELIRSRMLREVARIWGYKESEMDVSGFDPLVNLLVSACSTEFEKLSKELNQSNTRVLQRLVESLTPDVFTAALPAHALAHARPIEPRATVHPKISFFQSWEHQEVVKDVYFSALDQYPLFDATVKYLASGSQLFEIRDYIHKEPVLKASGKTLEPGVLWIGLEINPQLEALDGMQFCFDWKLEANRSAYLDLLPFTRWSFLDQPIPTSVGLPKDLLGKDSLFDELDTVLHIRNDIRNHYQHQFVRIDGTPSYSNKLRNLQRNYPDQFKTIFSIQDLLVIQQELLWIKVQFPETISEDALDKVSCQLNCFPILNQEWKDIYLSLKPNLNIVPLKSDGYFFAFERLYNQEGFNYQYANSPESQQYNAGTFTLRKSGTGRFDDRDATELIDQLLDLLRDESTAFSAMGLDIYSSDIRELNQLITRISNQLSSLDRHQDPVPYLIVKPKRDNETVYAEFWTTKGSFANNIAAGNYLNLVKDTSIRRDSLVLVSSTQGGRNKLHAEESIIQYKQALMNRGRLVTPEDIRSYCFARLKDRVTEVEVEKGCQIDQRPGFGIVRTLDIYLTPSDQRGEGLDWTITCENIRQQIEQLSTGVLPIRVFAKVQLHE